MSQTITTHDGCFGKNVENKKLKNLKGNKTFSGTNCILINKENVLIGHEGIS